MTRLLAILPALAAGLLLTGAATAQSFEHVPVDSLVDAHLEFLASDALGGRETGTPKGDITALYVASVFRAAGLEPAGDDGTFMQPYELEMSQLEVDDVELTVGAGEVTESFTLGEDYVLRGYTRAGFQVDAEDVVFVGYGLVFEDEQRDDLGDVDVTGKVVVALSGRPEGSKASSSWRQRRKSLQQRGAAGLIMVLKDDDKQSQSFFSMLQRSLDRRTMGLPGGDQPGFPFVMMQSEPATRLLTLGGVDLAAERTAREADTLRGSIPMPDVTLDLAAPVRTDVLVAHNVAGLIRGSDPEVADEVIVMSAHMDHIGTDSEGNVNNGADDNGSGTTTLLTTAGILSDNPAPRRSVLFLAVSAEEKGLLGSRWWVDHPTVPLENVIANVNIDMVGRNDSDAIGATPSPTHEHHNDLVTRSVELAPEMGLKVEWEAGNGEYRRPVDDYYYRSDHVNFANKDIPVVFFFSGEHEDYHRPSDTIEKIDRGKVGRMARFVSRLLTEVADADERPVKIAP